MSAETPMSNSDRLPSRQPSLPSCAKPRGVAASISRQASQYLLVAALAVGCYFFASHFLLQSITVVGRSMTPTLADSQRYLLNRWMFYCRSPQRSDVVVLHDLIDNSLSVKRIVGAPGDTIRLEGGSVYLNGQPLSEPYLLRGTVTFADPETRRRQFTCGKARYFVMGDNRMNFARQPHLRPRSARQHPRAGYPLTFFTLTFFVARRRLSCRLDGISPM